jgi:hypothetical protein
VPKAKGYVSERHHARAAGERLTFDVGGTPSHPGISPGDDVSQKVYDALWGREAGPAQEGSTAEDLSKLRVADLRARAEAAGVPGASKAKKADLIAALS